MVDVEETVSQQQHWCSRWSVTHVDTPSRMSTLSTVDASFNRRSQTQEEPESSGHARIDNPCENPPTRHVWSPIHFYQQSSSCRVPCASDPRISIGSAPTLTPKSQRILWSCRCIRVGRDSVRLGNGVQEINSWCTSRALDAKNWLQCEHWTAYTALASPMMTPPITTWQNSLGGLAVFSESEQRSFLKQLSNWAAASSESHPPTLQTTTQEHEDQTLVLRVALLRLGKRSGGLKCRENAASWLAGVASTRASVCERTDSNTTKGALNTLARLAIANQTVLVGILVNEKSTSRTMAVRHEVLQSASDHATSQRPSVIHVHCNGALCTLHRGIVPALRDAGRKPLVQWYTGFPLL